MSSETTEEAYDYREDPEYLACSVRFYEAHI